VSSAAPLASPWPLASGAEANCSEQLQTGFEIAADNRLENGRCKQIVKQIGATGLLN